MPQPRQVEEEDVLLDQIQTKQGRVLFIKEDESENNCHNKLKIMDLEGALDIVLPSSGWDFDWFEEQARKYNFDCS